MLRTNVCVSDLQLSREIFPVSESIVPYKSMTEKIWRCHKICQGQPVTIIWTNFVGSEYPTLNTKFQGHQPVGSGEEDFLSYMGMAAILVIWPGAFE